MIKSVAHVKQMEFQKRPPTTAGTVKSIFG